MISETRHFPKNPKCARRRGESSNFSKVILSNKMSSHQNMQGVEARARFLEVIEGVEFGVEFGVAFL